MSCSKPIRSRRWKATPVALAAGTVMAAGALLPLPARAVATLLFGDITYEAHAEIIHPGVGSYTSDPPIALQAAVEAFVTPVPYGPGWGFNGYEYGTPTNHPTQAFASARKSLSGPIDLGASGRSEGPGSNDWGRITADMITTGRVTNTGDYGVADLIYTIPRIEIDQRGTRFNGLVAEVDANMQLAMYDAGGTLLFDFSRRYTLSFEYDKPPTTYANLTYTASPDLLNDSGGLFAVQDSACLGCQGKAVGPFSVSREYVLDTGDYLEWTIHMSVYQVTGREGGGHALYGDPLEVTGGGRFLDFTPGTVPVGTVPEPASWVLLGLGGAWLRWRRRIGSAL